MSQPPDEAAVPEPRGARRKQASRQRLLDAARSLFVTRGYHATRPQDISKEAGLGHGTFYLHFKDKQECFMAFVEQARADVSAAITERAASARTLSEMVEAVLTGIYDYSEANPGVLVTVMSDDAIISAGAADGGTILERWGQQWGEVLKVQAQQGLVATDYDVQIIGQAIVGAIQQASSFTFKRGGSRAALVKSLTQFIVRALSPAR